MNPWPNLYDTCHQNNAHQHKNVHRRQDTRERLTNSGTSLLIMSCTTSDSDELFAKLTRYLREKVSVTCWFISIDTPPSPSPSPSEDFLDFLEGFAGW
jgi:hypothetical protein